ncbi:MULTISPECIES: hypothetical protein [Metallosphaera]|nr:hypothetical protein [Metallosphaera sedula]
MSKLELAYLFILAQVGPHQDLDVWYIDPVITKRNYGTAAFY